MKKQTLLTLLGCGLSAVLFFAPVVDAQASDATRPAAAQPKNAEGIKPAVRQEDNSAAVSINSASAAEMAAALSGIGLKKAQAIVDYREQNGEFTQIDQLKEVTGIGSATVEHNRDRLKL